MVAGVDLLHLDLRVNVTMIEEVDVSRFDLRNAFLMRHHIHDVFQRQQEVTLNLRINVFA